MNTGVILLLGLGMIAAGTAVVYIITRLFYMFDRSVADEPRASDARGSSHPKTTRAYSDLEQAFGQYMSGYNSGHPGPQR